MSSRTRIWSELWPYAAALLAVLVACLAAPVPAYAAVPLPVDAVLAGSGKTSLVVDLSASTRPGNRTVTVTRDGTPQPADLVPVMNDDLAVTLVVDTSAAAGSALPAWLSGAARFILEAPDTTRGVIIADTKPAAAITLPQRGPTEIVQALSGVKARGERDTAAALALAAAQFRDAPAGHRVTVLYTTAADAGVEAAADLAARFRAAGTLLVVAGTTDGGTYWSEAASATGGFFAPAGNPVVVPALDQVQTTLSSRYLVVFPTPPHLPARMAVQVGTGDLTLTADVVIPSPGSAAARPSSGVSAGTVVWWSLAAAGLVGLIVVFVLLWRLRAATGGGASPVVATPAPVPDQPLTARNAPARVAWATSRNRTGWNSFPAAARTESSHADRAAPPPTEPPAAERAASHPAEPPAVSHPTEPPAASHPTEPPAAESAIPATDPFPDPHAALADLPPAPASPSPIAAPASPPARDEEPAREEEPARDEEPPREEEVAREEEPVADTAVHVRATAAAPAPWAGNLPVYALPEGPGPLFPDQAPPIAVGRAAVPPYVARGRAHVPGATAHPDDDESADDVSDNESGNSD